MQTSRRAKRVRSKAKATWSRSHVSDGVIEIKCRGWSSFVEFLNKYVVDTTNYIWRGQRCSDWQLIASLDRILAKIGKRDSSEIHKQLLDRFKLAVRGRLERAARPESENEWWALGQHFGLATPLLDWTSSPFIAAYFAFNDSAEPQTQHRVVYGLSATMVSRKSKSLSDSGEPTQAMVFVSPLTDDNPRLLHQRGLFTRAPSGTDVESWVRQHFQGRTTHPWILIKLIIPDSSRNMVLRSLERMAVSGLELFPDISGASLYCNLSLEIDDYCQKLADKGVFESFTL